MAVPFLTANIMPGIIVVTMMMVAMTEMRTMTGRSDGSWDSS